MFKQSDEMVNEMRDRVRGGTGCVEMLEYQGLMLINIRL